MLESEPKNTVGKFDTKYFRCSYYSSKFIFPADEGGYEEIQDAESGGEGTSQQQPLSVRTQGLKLQDEVGFSFHNTKITEFKLYIEKQAIGRTEDVFVWWKNRKNNYPNLAKLARYYLCIPATSSERHFSAARWHKSNYGSQKSIIWNFFTEKPKSETLVVCGICKELNFKSTSNNLRKHMTRKDTTIKLDLYEPPDGQPQNYTDATTSKTPCVSNNQLEGIPQPKIPRTLTAKKQVHVDGFLRKKMGISAQRNITEELMLLFTHDLQPFSVVEDYGFRRFVGILNPSYQLPSRKTVTNTLLPAKYQEVYSDTKNI
nr:unnamed protein product [Callosobruchus analis]